MTAAEVIIVADTVDQATRARAAARFYRGNSVTHREPLPEIKSRAMRRLIHKFAALEARERGENVFATGDGSPPPRTVGLDLQRLTVGEVMACMEGGANLLAEACWAAGEQVVLLAGDGHQVCGAELAGEDERGQA